MTKGLMCLSCGEKDVPYPPSSQFQMGKDGEMYFLTDKEFLKPEYKPQEIQDKSNAENLTTNISVKTKEFKLSKKEPAKN